jgi:transcriptional regulator with XRE-family HTH domain
MKQSSKTTDISKFCTLHIGSKLRERRISLGMSQEKLGTLIGVTFQQVQKYETGKNRISSATLFLVSKILYTPIEYFYAELENIKEFLNNNIHGNGINDGDNEKIFDSLKILSPKITKELGKLNAAYLNIESENIRHSVINLAGSLSKEKPKETRDYIG